MPATRWGRQRDTTVSIYGLQVAKHESRDIIEHDSFYSSFMLCSLFQLCSFCTRGINRVALLRICANEQVFALLLAFAIVRISLLSKTFTPRSLQFNTGSFNTWNNLYLRLLTRDFRSRIKLLLNNIYDKKETPRIQSRKRTEAAYIVYNARPISSIEDSAKLFLLRKIPQVPRVREMHRISIFCKKKEKPFTLLYDI